jgi:insertion element IS1 protein InsB
VLHVSPTTGLKARKKKQPEWQPVHHAVLALFNPEQVAVESWCADELEGRRGRRSERNEMGSCVPAKAPPRGRWPALDHHTGPGFASVLGRRKDTGFLRRQELLEPLGIPKYSPDGWGAYARQIDAAQHHVGQEHAQKIASKHIHLRTRIQRFMRRTRGFSKTEQMHDLVLGLFMNR